MSHLNLFELLFLFDIETASSTVSGSGSPEVSGSRRAASPPTQDEQPMIMKVNSGFVLESEAMVGVSRPPTLADVEHRPMAEFLTGVGNSSAVNTKTIENAAEAPNFPNNDKMVVNRERWEGRTPAIMHVLPARI